MLGLNPFYLLINININVITSVVTIATELTRAWKFYIVRYTPIVEYTPSIINEHT